MKTLKLLLILTGLAALAACGSPAAAPPAAAPEAAADTGGAQIANPASVNCEQKGGKLEIVDEPGGQKGICTLPDGTKCEEWAYFRGECP